MPESGKDILRIGCLGAARIAPQAIVHPARVHGGVTLSRVAARDPSRAAAFADAQGFAGTAASYADLVAAADVDLVYLPLPNDLHAAWTIRALEAGKHVLCEKPLAMNADQAEAMRAAAEKSSGRLVEAFHYRYHPAFETCLRWLAEGRIGRLERIEAYFNAPIADTGGREIRYRPERGGGAFMDLGCYALSCALMANDADVESVEASATLADSGVDLAMAATLVFADGVVAGLAASMAPGGGVESRLTLTGSDGELRFDNPVFPHAGGRLLLTRKGRTEAYPVSGITTYLYQLDAVVRGIHSGEALPTEGAAALRQQRILDAIYAAAGLGDLRRGATTS